MDGSIDVQNIQFDLANEIYYTFFFLDTETVKNCHKNMIQYKTVWSATLLIVHLFHLKTIHPGPDHFPSVSSAIMVSLHPPFHLVESPHLPQPSFILALWPSHMYL